MKIKLYLFIIGLVFSLNINGAKLPYKPVQHYKADPFKSLAQTTAIHNDTTKAKEFIVKIIAENKTITQSDQRYIFLALFHAAAQNNSEIIKELITHFAPYIDGECFIEKFQDHLTKETLIFVLYLFTQN
ncbi:MAG: hypothetical protein V1855_05160, partial [bacterium]